MIPPLWVCSRWSGVTTVVTVRPPSQHKLIVKFSATLPNRSRGYLELPEGILTTRECTCYRLTLLGNVVVHCETGIFYEGQVIRHLVLMLHEGQLSDVTPFRPVLASAAAAHRSDACPQLKGTFQRVVHRFSPPPPFPHCIYCCEWQKYFYPLNFSILC